MREHDWRAVVEAWLASARLDPSREAEIVEELAQHLQDRYDELRVAGATADDAFAATLRELEEQPAPRARTLQRKMHAPRAGGKRMIGLSTLSQDLRYAARTLRKAPVFSAVVILTLALGIGATTAIFSVADAVMLRPLPYPDVERILILGEQSRNAQRMSVSWLNFQDWRDQNQVFESLGLYRGMIVNLTGGDQPERLNGSLASAAVFDTFGLRPVLGRAFQPDDDKPTAARIALISERLWRTHFNADPTIVGRQLQLNGQAHTIVGIMPPAARIPSRLTDVWLPIGLFVETFPKGRGAHPGLIGAGKLKPGVSFEQATASMDAIARRLEQQYPDSNRNVIVTMTPYRETIVQNIRPALLVLLAAVGTILLIACANLASLLLARADRRQREIAVRAALGAGRARLIRQMLTESLLLALSGGALGVLLAILGVRLFVASGPTSVPRIDLIAVDLRVLAFALLVSLATGVLFGLLPALRGSAPDLLATLQSTTRGATRGSRVTSTLVVVEIGLAVVLLVAAGLTIKSFAKLMAIDPGFDPTRVITMRLSLPDAKYPDRARWTRFHEDLLQRVAALPGVEAAGLNSALPLEGGGAESAVMAEGQPLPKPGSGPPPNMCLFQAVTPEYFRAMGIPIVKGRAFSPRDTAEAVAVAVVDEPFARRLFPGQDPIGKRFAFELRGEAHGGPPDPSQIIWREIVGVVPHVRHYGLATEPPFVQVYTTVAQLPIWFEQRRPSMALFVRTQVDPDAMIASIRGAVGAIDRDIPLYNIQPMVRYLANATEQPRLSVTLLGGLALLAMVLAVLGIYGLLSYAVTERQREIGVRMTFGATRGDVLRLIVGRGMMLTGLGLACGLLASWLVTRWMQTLLYEVSPHDPVTFVTIVALLGGVAFFAAYLPARRATHVDPVVTLRYE
jgi:putative ABC transport system permease protein